MPWGSSDQPRTRAWAAQVKRNAGYRCQIGQPGCTGAADVADHIVPIAEGGALYDLANGQAACHHCHDPKTAAEQQRGRQRYYGRGKHRVERHPGLT